MSDILTEVRFWTQVIGDQKRTVFCSPDLEARLRGWIEARGMGHLLTVKASQACPDTQVFIVDEQGIEAEWQQALSRPVRIR